MVRARVGHVGVVKVWGDARSGGLVEAVAYIRLLGIADGGRGDELTAILNFDEKLIGNPFLPAIHGGVTAAFLEVTSVVTLNWAHLWPKIESGELDPNELTAGKLPRQPKTIDFTVDYLRSGLPRDAYARATVNRAGRRYASVHVEAWQEHKDRLFAQATCHFLIPQDPVKKD